MDLAGHSVSLTQSYARGRNVEIELRCAEPSLLVRASAIEIEQVMVNILRNGVEAQPRSGRLFFRVWRRGDLACIEIADDGGGIDPDIRGRIFDPFFTTRLSQGGSGLGLSVAHGIVADHGGKIRVDSEVGKGTRISIEIPVAQEEKGSSSIPLAEAHS